MITHLNAKYTACLVRITYCNFAISPIFQNQHQSTLWSIRALWSFKTNTSLLALRSTFAYCLHNRRLGSAVATIFLFCLPQPLHSPKFPSHDKSCTNIKHDAAQCEFCKEDLLCSSISRFAQVRSGQPVTWFAFSIPSGKRVWTHVKTKEEREVQTAASFNWHSFTQRMLTHILS